MTLKSLVGLVALYVLNPGCESKEESSSQQDAMYGSQQNVMPEPLCPNYHCVCDAPDLDGELRVNPWEPFYICDIFEGESIEADVWTVSTKGKGVSYGVNPNRELLGQLTISSSQAGAGLDSGVYFSSAQSASLPESGNFHHGIEARIKLGASSSFALGDGKNMCKIATFNGGAAICGGYSISETDYYEAELTDVSEWHTYFMSTRKALDGSDDTEVVLYQDQNEILKFHQGPSIKYTKFSTDINCWLPEIGSCAFDYVRARVTDQNVW